MFALHLDSPPLSPVFLMAPGVPKSASSMLRRGRETERKQEVNTGLVSPLRMYILKEREKEKRDRRKLGTQTMQRMKEIKRNQNKGENSSGVEVRVRVELTPSR